jgi:hypothetical protein
VIRDKKVHVRVSKKLAAVSKEYPTASSVQQLADEILAPLNSKQLYPESTLKITDFIESRYFPIMKSELRPMTHSLSVSIASVHAQNLWELLPFEISRPVR